MADCSEKYPENASGKFYVDRKCIGCVSCVSVAPDHFQMVDGNSHSRVLRQPETPDEFERCRQAEEICPVNAIGSDGQEALPGSFKDEILASLRRFGPRPALVEAESGMGVSYSELGQRLDQVARLLLSQGIRQGDVVAVVSENSLDLACLLLGCIAYGAVAMPLSPKLSQQEMARLLGHASAKLLLGEETLPGLDAPLQLPLNAFRSLEPLERAQWSSLPLPPESGALLIYTSGSTGSPKGVLLSQANLSANVRFAVKAFRMDEEHDTLCLLPLYHSFGFVSDLSTAFLSGSRCVLLRGFELSRMDSLSTALSLYGARSFSAVPLVFELLLRWGGRLDRSGLRYCISGAAPLHPSTPPAFKRRYGIPLLPAYGLTETTCFCTLTPPGKEAGGSVGWPAGTRIRIVGDDDRELEPGQAGEILVKGPSVMAGGYFRAEAAPPENPAHAGWLRTGDLGQVDAEGRLFVTGRKKNMVIRGGEKIYLEDVDLRLKALPGVADCASVRLDGGELERFACFIVREEGASLDEGAVQRWIEEGMGLAKRPDRVHFISAIPRGATHKVRLAELKARDAAVAGGRRP